MIFSYPWLPMRVTWVQKLGLLTVISHQLADQLRQVEIPWFAALCITSHTLELPTHAVCLCQLPTLVLAGLLATTSLHSFLQNSVYCVFTVNGGNTRAKSSVVPVLPNRPIVYDDDEPDRLFYTNQSRQLFILCRKVRMYVYSEVDAYLDS